MTASEPRRESRANGAFGGLLYRLAVVFRSCAGAFLALYTLRMRFR